MINKNIFYTGWAMDSYPEMDEKDIARHVTRQMDQGANFIWMGHNNPGEVDAKKIEPGLSYAVWEAFEDSRDLRHKDALQIIEAQRRLLDFCLKEKVPVVLPVGYQIQMGERWNMNHPDALRRHLDGAIINWGGVSACFYAPEYQEDILRYYKWVVRSFVEHYHPILLLINLADEPFGGDYSPCAEEAFRKKTGLCFQEALNGSRDALCALGRFQSHYIVEYARWSAEAWHSVCPEIPSTISFCGHHGREENTMPGIPALFRDTPEYFHPTFDVYPRDGNQATPIKESDVVMLALFLRQLGYLSAKHGKPYWLWTTGNSWGLGQASEDPANITDAVVNQIMALTSAQENGALLRGIAVWNYNVKHQGLYNDNIKTVYDTEDMFHKLTRVIAHLRDFVGDNSYKPPKLGIVLERDFAHRFIAQSRETTWVRPFPFEKFVYPAKNNIPLLMDDRLAELLSYCDRRKLPYPQYLIYLASGDDAVEPAEQEALLEYLRHPHRILLPRGIHNSLKNCCSIIAEVVLYEDTPGNISENLLATFFKEKTSHSAGLFHLSLGDFDIAYNLSGETQKILLPPAKNAGKFFLLTPFADVKSDGKRGSPKKGGLVLGHHEAAFIAKKRSPRLEQFLKALEI